MARLFDGPIVCLLCCLYVGARVRAVTLVIAVAHFCLIGVRVRLSVWVCVCMIGWLCGLVCVPVWLPVPVFAWLMVWLMVCSLVRLLVCLMVRLLVWAARQCTRCRGCRSRKQIRTVR